MVTITKQHDADIVKLKTITTILGSTLFNTEYELVADLMFWDQAYSSVDKFLNQLHQRYAFNLITKVSEEQGLEFVEK